MFEALAIKESNLHQNLESNYNEQNATRIELKRKIDISKGILNLLRKKTTD